MNTDYTTENREVGMRGYEEPNTLDLHQCDTVLVCVTCRLPNGGLPKATLRTIYAKWVELGDRYRSSCTLPYNPGKRASSYFELSTPPSAPRAFMFLHTFAGDPDGLQPAEKHKQETEQEFRTYLGQHGISDVDEQQHFLHWGGSNFP